MNGPPDESGPSSVKRLMRPLVIVVMRKFLKSLTDAGPTAHSRVVQAVDAHFEGVKLRFDRVSIGIVHPTVQS